MAQQMAGEQAQHMAQMAGRQRNIWLVKWLHITLNIAAQHAAMDMANNINEGNMPPPPEGMGPPGHHHLVDNLHHNSFNKNQTLKSGFFIS